jgi:hypothetical protein
VHQTLTRETHTATGVSVSVGLVVAIVVAMFLLWNVGTTITLGLIAVVGGLGTVALFTAIYALSRRSSNKKDEDQDEDDMPYISAWYAYKGLRPRQPQYVQPQAVQRSTSQHTTVSLKGQTSNVTSIRAGTGSIQRHDS